ncbi:MAG: AEC family transporter [Thermodesulfobacteriota bacterium]
MSFAALQQISSIVFPVFIIIGVGFIFSKLRKIELTSINELVVYITTPCLIISSLSKFPIDLAIAGKIFVIISLIIFISILIATALIRFLELDYKVYLPPVLFANTGNMGLPLVLFAFGEYGFNIGILCLVANTILHYSVGIIILNSSKNPWEIFKLPLIYATAVGIVISVTQFELPLMISRSIELLGDISIPAMIFALGYKLSELRLSKLFTSFLFGSLRIFLGLFLGAALVKLFGLKGIEAKVVILQAAMPPAVFNFVLAEKYNQDSKTVASIIMAGTIVSFFAIPLIISYLLK